MISMSDYAIIKNNYCICYFGYCEEYLIQLKLLRPYLERKFPGLNIFLSCKDDFFHLIDQSEKTLKLSEIKLHKSKFAYIREIQFNGHTHPVEDLMIESNILKYHIADPKEIKTNNFIICTKSSYPTNPLSTTQITTLKRMAYDLKLEPIIDDDIKGAGMVAGVESYSLYQAASQGIPTILVPTGIGTRLYKNMFPNSQILSS